MQRANVASLIGDDGLVCTPIDAVSFVKGLMESRILKESSLKLMKDWVTYESGKPAYGMGLYYIDLGGLEGWGHGGGGIGAGCSLIYVPDKETYVFLATNVGVLIEGKIAKIGDAMKNEILAVILQ